MLVFIGAKRAGYEDIIRYEDKLWGTETAENQAVSFLNGHKRVCSDRNSLCWFSLGLNAQGMKI